MKLLFVTEFFPRDKTKFTGGVEARIFYLTKHLTFPYQVISRPKTHVSVSFLSIFPRLYFQVHAIWQSYHLKPDLVEGSNFNSYLPAFLIARLKKVPSVAWYADIYQKDWFKLFPFPTALAGFLLEWVSLRLPWDGIIAMSQTTKAKLTRAGIPQDKITVIYGGADNKTIKNIKVAKFANPTIITLARLVTYKRIQDLIDALPLILPTIPNLKLIIIGDGPFRPSLENQVAKLNLNSHVSFKGALSHSQAWSLLKRSHLFCLPSVVEGFGLVTIEAMASGVPYVNSDIPPTREITQNGQGGLLFKPKNPQDLATKAIKLLTNKPLYQTKASQGLKLSQNYSWETITKQSEEYYSQVVKSYNNR